MPLAVRSYTYDMAVEADRQIAYTHEALRAIMRAMKRRGLVGDLWRTRRFKIWVIYVFVLVVALIIGVVVIQTNSARTTSIIPKGIKETASFPIYFYQGSIPGGFIANKDTVSLTAGVLFVRMRNGKNQLVTITQQALPPDLAESSLQSTEEVSGAAGKASISVREGQLTGNLLTADKKTLVIINTSDAISPEMFKVLLRSLKPLP